MDWTPEQIVARLTKPQKEGMLRGTCSAITLRVFFDYGLATSSVNDGDYPHFPERPRLSEKGKAVRTQLLEAKL